MLSGPDADKIVEFCEKELNFKPLIYIPSGCLCGHYDICHCPSSTYKTGWEREAEALG